MFLSLETEPSTVAAMKAQDWRGFLKLDYFLLAHMHTRAITCTHTQSFCLIVELLPS